MDIYETDWGVANTYSDRIEINYHLQEFPELRKKVIEHEREHASTLSWVKNRKIDMLTDLTFKDLLPFFRKYPKTFIQQYTPIHYSQIDKTIYFEWSLIILYSLIMGGLGFIYWLIRLFSKDSQFFWKVIEYAIILLIISYLVYMGGKKLIKYLNEQGKLKEK